MPELLGFGDPGVSARMSAWWAHHSHRYLLPILGGASLGTGIGYFLLGPVPTAIPPVGVLLILGAVTVSLSMVTTALRMRLESDWAPAATVLPLVEGPSCPVCAEPEESHPAAHALLRQIEVWNLLRRRSTTASFASTTGATPTDFMWSSWVSAGHALPVELVGPVPETAYVVPRPGSPDPFPDQGVPSAPPDVDEDAPMRPERFRGPGSVGDAMYLDPAPHGYDIDHPQPEPLRTSSDVRRAGWTERSGAFLSFTVPGSRTGSTAGTPSAENPPEVPEMDWLQREAMTPVPPHLRPVARRPGPRPMSYATIGASAVDLYCATCQEAIETPEVWRRCPDCSRPICPECIVTALLEQDRGWCEGCAEARLEAEGRIAS